MRSTSNPAFRNLPVGGGGYAGFNSAPAGYGYGTDRLTTSRPMTVDDVVAKTSITLAVLVATGAATFFSGLSWLALPALFIGFVLAMVIIFKKVISPPLILAYAAAEGVVLGAISDVVSRFQPGAGSIVLEAITGTLLVFGGMLVVYKTGAVKVTPRFTKWLMGAMIGVVGLMIVNIIAGFFTGGVGLGLRSGGTLAIVFSLVCIGVAAFSFLIDFDEADQAIRTGAPEKTAWYIAFGLTMTLVWLYLEILRLLSYFRE
ncbi:MAG TPA: Bax inhibitor-1/YccA family protein [Pseudonocardiaceae bacterium]|nr:Bax inhibitor-1/YccA family protein [Pseudonocardiaceae bacterium]